MQFVKFVCIVDPNQQTMTGSGNLSSDLTLGINVATTEGTLTFSQAFEGDLKTVLALTVPDESTDLEVPINVPIANLQFLVISSDKDITFKTNSDSAPDFENELLPNQPYIWYANAYDDNKIEDDITSVFITNASGAAATVSVRALIEATEYA
jgi:hypothetical protein